MEYELTDIGPCRKRLVLKFEAAEVDKALDDSYAEVDNYVQIKGFRRGKAPRRILEKKFSKEARQGTEERLTEKNVRETIEKEKLAVLGPVTPQTAAGTLQPGAPYALTVEFDFRPDFELPEYKGLEFNARPEAIPEEKVDAGIERFRKMFAKHDPVDGPAEVGDILNVNFRGSVEGKEFMHMLDKNLRVEGDQLFGMPYPELIEKFKGAKAGDRANVQINLPDEHPDETLRGKLADVEIEVNNVQRPRLPELTDEFAANLGMANLASFRERIRTNLINEEMLAVRTKQEQEIIDQMIAATSFPIPETFVKNETEAILNHERMEASRRGLAGEALAKAVEEKRPEAMQTAERRVRWEIISSRIVEKEGIEVSQAEIANHVDALAHSYNTTPAKILQRVKEFNGVPAMIKEIMDIKVIQFIIDNSKSGKNASGQRAEDIEKANSAAADVGNKPGAE